MDPSSPETDPTTAGAAGATKETSATQLTAEHVEYLRARAVPVNVAVKAGLRSVSAEEAGRLLGRRGPTASPGLAIPYPDISPPRWRVRLDQPANGARYLCETGLEVPIYLPPIEGGEDRPTIIVEGPVKALALAAAGFRAVGLGGTSTTLTKDEEPRRLNESWKGAAVRNKAVVIVFDSDRTANRSVARDEAALAIALETDGAKVRVAVLPAGPDGKSWGPDDFLAGRGVEALQTVIDSAHPADPIARAQSTEPATAAALLDDLPFLFAVTKRGPGCRSQVRQALKSIGKISVRDFDDALAQARAKLRKAEEGSGTENGFGGQYLFDGGAIYMMEGKEPTQLCNFTAEIERETLSDDGVTETRSFELTGRTQDGKTLPKIVVTPDELRTEGWALEHWGSCAVVGPIPGTASHIRVAILTKSNPEDGKGICAHRLA